MSIVEVGHYIDLAARAAVCGAKSTEIFASAREKMKSLRGLSRSVQRGDSVSTVTVVNKRVDQTRTCIKVCLLIGCQAILEIYIRLQRYTG